MRKLLNPQTANQGHSLPEVLVALLVINVVVLGFLRTQHSGERSNRFFIAHAAAVSALNNAEAMILISPNDVSIDDVAFGTPPPAPGCRGKTCAANTWAKDAVAGWKCRFETWFEHPSCAEEAASSAQQADTPERHETAMFDLIPDGDGQIRATNNQFEIAVRWHDGEREHTLTRTVSRLAR